jgi:hypothetical protein
MSSPSLSRREMLAASAGALALLVTRKADASPLLYERTITIFKSPTCGCCKKWVDHVRAAGFVAVVHDVDDMDAVKKREGVPKALQSCHTAIANGYVIEGHVPAADVLRLLRERPKGVRGVAAPGMPGGSPGMEMGGPADKYDVVAFTRDGATRVFAKH